MNIIVRKSVRFDDQIFIFDSSSSPTLCYMHLGTDGIKLGKIIKNKIIGVDLV